jgi:hypothetical protein
VTGAPPVRMRRRGDAALDPVRPVPFGQSHGSALAVTFPGATEPPRGAAFNQMPQAAAVSESMA